MSNLSQWLDVPNEGDEAYPLRGWPVIAQEDANVYREWFDQEWISGKLLYSTHLPALHRLLFAIVNNILTPKSIMKPTWSKM
jgi:hypothetical protein